MKISNLQLTNFRNWENVALDFSDRILIFGPNALGKTNILEALYMLATTRSFRSKDAQIVKNGMGFSRLSGTVSKKEKESLVELTLEKKENTTEKIFKINEKPRPAIDFVGEFAVIAFSPEDINLISGPPENKRRYLSFTIGQKDREYLYDLLNYKRILRQRNELLKKADLGIIKEEIDIWDRNLATYGQKVIEKRNQFAGFINERIETYYQELAEGELNLEFVYATSTQNEDLHSALVSNRDQDIRNRITSVGPHRDSWDLMVPEGDFSSFASRGELRTAVLSLKLCERDWFLSRGSETPVVLLDDVFSELDEKRRKYLVEAFSASQMFITTTDLDHLDRSLQVGTQIINIENIACRQALPLEMEERAAGEAEDAPHINPIAS